MPLDPKYATIHYLVGRLCAEVYPEGSGAMPEQVVAKATVNPIEAIGLLDLPDNEGVAEIMALMPADPPNYPRGAKVELQGDFWVGYYHQRAAIRKARAMTPNMIERAGTTLFGERWQTDLAAALGFGDASRIRQMLTGRRPVPPGVAADILALLRKKSAEAKLVADEIERLTDEK